MRTCESTVNRTRGIIQQSFWHHYAPLLPDYKEKIKIGSGFKRITFFAIEAEDENAQPSIGFHPAIADRHPRLFHLK